MACRRSWISNRGVTSSVGHVLVNIIAGSESESKQIRMKPTNTINDLKKYYEKNSETHEEMSITDEQGNFLNPWQTANNLGWKEGDIINVRVIKEVNEIRPDKAEVKTNPGQKRKSQQLKTENSSQDLSDKATSHTDTPTSADPLSSGNIEKNRMIEIQARHEEYKKAKIKLEEMKQEADKLRQINKEFNKKRKSVFKEVKLRKEQLLQSQL